MTQQQNFLRRYQRQLDTPQVGCLGQKALAHASVLLIGAGGLGSVAALYLAAGGVHNLTIIDPDVIELENLSRQVPYHTKHIGLPKVFILKKALKANNPTVQVKTAQHAFHQHTPLDSYQWVVDATDNPASRALIARQCYKHRKPLIFAAVSTMKGYLTTFCPWTKETPCLFCLFSETLQTSPIDSCQQGVLGACAGVMGTLQALEVIKQILGKKSLIGSLMTCDFETMVIKKTAVPPDPRCPLCGLVL